MDHGKTFHQIELESVNKLLRFHAKKQRDKRGPRHSILGRGENYSLFF